MGGEKIGGEKVLPTTTVKTRIQQEVGGGRVKSERSKLLTGQKVESDRNGDAIKIHRHF